MQERLKNLPIPEIQRMMGTNYEFIEDIKVVLQKAAEIEKAPFNYRLTSEVVKQAQGFAVLKAVVDNFAKPKLEDNPDMYTLDFDLLNILIQIYNRIYQVPDHVKEYEKILILDITNSWHPEVALAALIKIDRLDLALQSFDKRLLSRMGSHGFVWEFLMDYIRYEYPTISDDKLKLFKSFFDGSTSRAKHQSYIDKRMNFVHSQLIECQLRRIRSKYMDLNSEINQDKIKVIQLIDFLGLGQNLIENIYNIDQVLQKPDCDSLAVKGAITSLRQALFDLSVKLAEKISFKTRIPLPKPQQNQTKIGVCRYYLKDHLEVTDREDKFINSFVDLLHGEVHSTTLSPREYLRLTRNIWVEIAVLLLSKYNNKFDKINFN